MKNKTYFLLFDYLYFAIKQNFTFIAFNAPFILVLFLFELEIQMIMIYLLTSITLPPSLSLLIRNYDLKINQNIELKFIDQIKQFPRLLVTLLPLSLIFNVIVLTLVFFGDISAVIPSNLRIVLSSLSLVYVMLFIPLLYYVGINKDKPMKDVIPYSIYHSILRFPISIIVTLFTLVFIYYLIIYPIQLTLIFPTVLTLVIYHFCKLLTYRRSN